MGCKCNKTNESGSGIVIYGVYGNMLQIAIPLTLRTLEKVGEEVVATDTDFIPSSEYPVTVEFKKDSVKVDFDAEMRDGNVAYVEDSGTIPVGTYDITVLCKDNNGRPYRFKQKTVLQVVDCTAEAGISQPIEFEAKVWYLDAAIYLVMKGDKGDPGVGIDDIIVTESDESYGENTITIVLDDGNEYTFTVHNGIYDADGYVHTDNNYTDHDKQIVGNVMGRVDDLADTLGSSSVGNVVYDAQDKELRGIPVDDGGDGNVLFRIDMTPFLNDAYVNDAYLANGILTIEYDADSGKEPLSVDLREWINPSSFYTKGESDGKYMTKTEGENFVQLNASGRIDSTVMPFVILSSMNLAYNGTPNAAMLNKAYYCTDSYIRYFYRKDNRINTLVSSPVPGVLYCYESTGDIYLWDASSRIFRLTNANSGVNLSNYYTKAQIDALLDGVEVDTSGLMSVLDYVSQRRIKFDKASRVVLDFIIFPVAPGEEHEERVLEGGDFYGDEDGHICYESIDLGVHTELAFVNAEDNKIYRWTGSAWQMVGGSGSDGYDVSFDNGNVIFSGSNQPTYNNGNIIFK